MEHPPFLMGKFTISLVIFNSKQLVITRGISMCGFPGAPASLDPSNLAGSHLSGSARVAASGTSIRLGRRTDPL